MVFGVSWSSSNMNLPPIGRDLRRMGHTEAPAGLVDFVDALVAEVAVAGVPEPVPVVVEAVLREGPLRGGAQPEIVVHAGRHGLLGCAPDGVAPLVAEPAGHVDLSELAAPHPLHRLAQRR